MARVLEIGGKIARAFTQIKPYLKFFEIFAKMLIKKLTIIIVNYVKLLRNTHNKLWKKPNIA